MTEEGGKSLDIRDDEKVKRHRIQAAVFLGVVGGTSALYGFSRTLSKTKKSEAKIIEKNGKKAFVLLDEGTMLAMRALGWGSLYAIAGTSLFCYGFWNFSGAKNMEEFRSKMGSSLPKLTKDEPPTSRTEFDGLTDLMKYLAAWSKE